MGALTRFISLILLLTLTLISTTVLHEAVAQPAVQRSEEMEFDARVIQGQRAEGAVYLFQRATRPLPSLLVYRKNYLSSIVTPIFDTETALGKASLKNVNKAGLKVGDSPLKPSQTSVTSSESQNTIPTPKATINKPKSLKPKSLKPKSKWQRSNSKKRRTR